ncbi:Uncharacterised protein [Achromobacter spanius]|uniref:hypothetical protein n=1 Tax=Achromobacter spanius TaxID=217203 RepID=UPI000C2CA31E|nr:hypothetical protein [Achromobacter spanius]AUA57910.1 hypothetical protein CVS48_18960 [Achromobacter spanius]CAB3626130.1 hypothetical protein LMG5911_00305 [Achromobacter spanius]SPT37301.1 Uncharacterised protein [Achromobacter denitrificans]VEE60040.1 Uncharacterised protein [Achromobacter spanius]
MKSHKLLLISAMLAVLPWHATTAQTSQTTLVAQAAPPPSTPMPTADDKMAPPNVIREPVPGAQNPDKQKMPATEEKTGASKPRTQDSNAPPKGDANSRPKTPDADTRGGGRSGDVKSGGSKTGAPDNTGMPGSGASSGSGGAADTR